MGKRAPAGLPDPGTRSGHANIRWGRFVIGPALFTKLVYEGV
jgi:hypothetical protein